MASERVRPAGDCSFFVASPPNIPGGVAIIQLSGDIETAFGRMGMPPVRAGTVALRDLLGVDKGVVARWDSSCAQLMPHGGVGIVRALRAALVERGITERPGTDPRAMYPEAESLIEARMLGALAQAASPLAIDLLLDQPRRWAAAPGADSQSGDERSGVLNRLIHPPLVVAMGPSNIGKSTLVNELAGRSVSIVADEPGTTRDHVGVMLDLGGLVVRYVDTPGLRSGAVEIEREAAELARRLGERADLLVLCADATQALPDRTVHPNILTVGLRADLGPACSPVELAVSVRQSLGLRELADAIRERLVPASLLNDPRPWRFW